jgi:hypothetical protein
MFICRIARHRMIQPQNRISVSRRLNLACPMMFADGDIPNHSTFPSGAGLPGMLTLPKHIKTTHR